MKRTITTLLVLMAMFMSTAMGPALADEPVCTYHQTTVLSPTGSGFGPGIFPFVITQAIHCDLTVECPLDETCEFRLDALISGLGFVYAFIGYGDVSGSCSGGGNCRATAEGLILRSETVTVDCHGYGIAVQVDLACSANRIS